MLVVILVIVAFSYLLLKEPEYTGPPLDEKFSQTVIVACEGSAARQELGKIITTFDVFDEHLCIFCYIPSGTY